MDQLRRGDASEVVLTARGDKDMTCILGMIDDSGDVYIGADSQMTNCWSGKTTAHTHEKLFFVGNDILIGGAGDVRELQILRHHLLDHIERAQHKKAQTLTQPEVFRIETDFVNAVRSCLRENGYLKTDNGVETLPEQSQLVIGYAGKLFKMFENFMCTESVSGLVAAGTGKDYATGAAEALRNLNDKIECRDIIHNAVSIASWHDASVGAPITVERLSLRAPYLLVPPAQK